MLLLPRRFCLLQDYFVAYVVWAWIYIYIVLGVAANNLYSEELLWQKFSNSLPQTFAFGHFLVDARTTRRRRVTRKETTTESWPNLESIVVCRRTFQSFQPQHLYEAAASPRSQSDFQSGHNT